MRSTPTARPTPARNCLPCKGSSQQVSRTAELDPSPVRDLPEQAVLDALRVNLVWNIVNRLANAFGFELLDGQLKTGTRALHRAGYRFPGFLLGEDHGDLRASVFDQPARTSPELRRAAAAGDGLEEPWRDYAALVRDASHRITDDDVRRLTRGGADRGRDLRGHGGRRGRRRAAQLRRRPRRRQQLRW